MKNLIPFLCLAFFFSCNKSSESCEDSNLKVEINEQLFDDLEAFSISFVDILIEGDCLTLGIADSGCDGSKWTGRLIDSGATTFSLPPQRFLKFVLDNPEDCEALIQKEFSFDIHDLKLEGVESVILKIENHRTDVVYSF